MTRNDSAARSPLWLVATPMGLHPRILRAASARGALLARVKDDEDVPKAGLWAVWRLGNFPEQYEIIDFDPAEVREIGRPVVRA